MPRSHILLAAALAALAAPCSAPAQTGAARAPVGCTYETCALRVEPSFFGAAKLLRGHAGEQVGSIGPFGGGLDTLLAGPDSAAVYGRRYATNIRWASTLGLIGTAVAVAAIVHSDNFTNSDGTTTALGLTSVGFAIASIPFTLRASRSLSRAIWFYNAALPTR
jgi:hypothetical protein